MSSAKSSRLSWHLSRSLRSSPPEAAAKALSIRGDSLLRIWWRKWWSLWSRHCCFVGEAGFVGCKKALLCRDGLNIQRRCFWLLLLDVRSARRVRRRSQKHRRWTLCLRGGFGWCMARGSLIVMKSLLWDLSGTSIDVGLHSASLLGLLGEFSLSSRRLSFLMQNLPRF